MAGERTPGPEGANDQPDPNSPSLRWFPRYNDAVAEREVPLGDVVLVKGKPYVIYLKEVRSGGSSSWLANNPGNMDYTAEQPTFGAYKDRKLPWGKHGFAIFPDEATGLAAVRKFLRAHQTIRNIPQMQELFAPMSDGNETGDYADAIIKDLNAASASITPKKVTRVTLVRDLSDAQIEVYANTIRRVEGWDKNKAIRQWWKLDDPTLPKAVQDRLNGKD
jgi:hypothetical protein